MENASKALLIAGAILIVILLIAVGVLVYQRSNGTISASTEQVDQMTEVIQKSDLSNTLGEAINEVKNTGKSQTQTNP